MAKKSKSGLVKRGEIWFVCKTVYGIRLRESTGESEKVKAEEYLVHRLEELRQQQVFGMRPNRIFREAATRFLETAEKRSIRDDANRLELADPFVGDIPLDKVHMGTLEPLILHLQDKDRSSCTINRYLAVIRRVLNLAAEVWRDESGQTWLAQAPKIILLSEKGKRKPHPLSWEEQRRLFEELPPHLKQMALFAVNTGCRSGEICTLQWKWERKIKDLDIVYFEIPGDYIKNGDDRLLIINRTAREVLEEVRGKHPEYVFTFKGNPIGSMHGSAWRKARVRAGMKNVRIHDFRHTYGKRLRSGGAPFEDCQDLLGHRSKRITDHYSSAEIHNLYKTANLVCDVAEDSPALVNLKNRRKG